MKLKNLLRFLAVVLVAVGLNVNVQVEEALITLFATDNIQEAAPIKDIIDINIIILTSYKNSFIHQILI